MKKFEYEALLQKMYSINNRLDEILKYEKIIQQTQEQNLVEKKDLVIIYDNRKTRIYQKGKEISDGIKSITFTAGEIPTIEYEKEIF
jgi:hypothetical protein